MIGSHGFSISMLAKLAEYLNTHPATLFVDILAHNKIISRDDRVRVLHKVLASVAIDSPVALLAAKSRRDKPPFGNTAV